MQKRTSWNKICDKDHYIYTWSWEPDILVVFMLFNIYFSVYCFVRIILYLLDIVLLVIRCTLLMAYLVSSQFFKLWPKIKFIRKLHQHQHNSLSVSRTCLIDNRNRDWYHSCRKFYWSLKFGVVSCETSVEIRMESCVGIRRIQFHSLEFRWPCVSLLQTRSKICEFQIRIWLPIFSFASYLLRGILEMGRWH